MRKKSVILFLLILVIGCQQQENELRTIDGETPANPYLLTRSVSNFFDTHGTDTHLQSVIDYLQLHDATHSFTPSFVEHYGNPLWREAYSFPLDDYSVYVVPVLKDAEIGTIWIFEMDDNQTRYYLIPRPDKGDPDHSLSWMFDYFNVNLSLRNTNDEGEIIVFTQPAQTRGIIIEYCNEIWSGYRDSNGVEHLEYRYTHCWTEYIENTTSPVQDGGGAGTHLPGIDDGYGGGGGGGAGVLPVGKKTSELFTSTGNLTEADKIKLENAINTMLEDCYAEAIYNYLTGKKVKFSQVSIDSTIMYDTEFGFSTHNITFRESAGIDAGAIYHEMFHIFQQFVNPAASTNEMRGLMEYERTLFEDIAFMIKHADEEGQILDHDIWGKRKSPWMYSMRTRAKDQTEYINWLGKLTNGFTTYPDVISSNDFSHWKSFFKTYTNSVYKTYNYDLDYSPVAIIKAFELSKNNCGN